jgi:hypothetical protein
MAEPVPAIPDLIPLKAKDFKRTVRSCVGPGLALAVLVTLSACTAPPTGCAPGTGAPMQVFTLYFGKAVPGRGDLTDKEWQDFQDDTVTANLPDGYTLLDARGAWMNPMTRRTTQEATKVLVVALPTGPDSLAAVNRVRTEYQARFHQQSVGMTVQPGCGSF